MKDHTRARSSSCLRDASWIALVAVGLLLAVLPATGLAAPKTNAKAEAKKKTESKKRSEAKKEAKKSRKNTEKPGRKVGTQVAHAPTVAVLYFDYTGKNEDMALLRKGLAQMMISDLVETPDIRLVERDRLEAVLAEMKLQRSRRFDKRTAARVGKLLGARYLVLGGYFALMGTLRIDARLVEVETGKVVASFGANGKQDDFITIEQGVSKKLQDALANKLPRMQYHSTRVRRFGKKKRRRPARPKVLPAKHVIEYAKALDAKDRGDIKFARAQLQKVVATTPDFTLAQMDLAGLAQ